MPRGSWRSTRAMRPRSSAHCPSSISLSRASCSLITTQITSAASTSLLQNRRVPLFGPGSERLPGEPTRLRQGDRVVLEELGLEFTALDIPGHTAGHIAYVGHGALFCGDTLFSAGCGRLFEGTPEQMVGSLAKLAQLPAETLGVLRPRVHGQQPEIRARGRARERRSCALPGRMQRANARGMRRLCHRASGVRGM